VACWFFLPVGAGGASAQDKAASDTGSNGYLIVPRLSPCQKAYGEAYQLYWQARNRAAVLVSNRQISVDSYVSMMSSLNGLWQPYVGQISKLNAADANSPKCAAATQALVTELGGYLSQMPDPAELSNSSPDTPAVVSPPPMPPPGG
jgi:hypothetical protein